MAVEEGLGAEAAEIGECGAQPRVIPIPPLAEIGVQIGQAMASELASKIADELYEKAKIRRLDLDEVLSNQ